MPPLVDDRGGLALRPWHPDDGRALVAAWSTPDIAAHSAAPAHADLEAAQRWIGGGEVRVAAGVSLDLVVGPVAGGAVWGEVGLARLHLRSRDGAGPQRRVWELGWWIVPDQRGRGLATAATGLLAHWAVSTMGITAAVARIEPGNLASEAVARRLGLTRRGRFDADVDLWAGPLGAAARPSGPPGPV
ncbi:GNAT family N-acetyltransferase [Iamia sp.]|uniref:GNAT family N-acetyltransferase n=1 Tax=Iamia sp. TaxID=2722710 RepID=UPI002BC95108|nr:GNAT family N-acetyltransferase [Iamia sp.]HXH57875.1 GNAT family N-acetyltransferase [Iamia sp.]